MKEFKTQIDGWNVSVYIFPSGKARASAYYSRQVRTEHKTDGGFITDEVRATNKIGENYKAISSTVISKIDNYIAEVA